MLRILLTVGGLLVALGCGDSTATPPGVPPSWSGGGATSGSGGTAGGGGNAAGGVTESAGNGGLPVSPNAGQSGSVGHAGATSGVVVGGASGSGGEGGEYSDGGQPSEGGAGGASGEGGSGGDQPGATSSCSDEDRDYCYNPGNNQRGYQSCTDDGPGIAACLVCDAGTLDCNKADSDGCEASNLDPLNCGRCAHFCNPDTPYCKAGGICSAEP